MQTYLLERCWSLWHLRGNEGDGRDSGKRGTESAMAEAGHGNWLHSSRSFGYLRLFTIKGLRKEEEGVKELVQQVRHSLVGMSIPAPMKRTRGSGGLQITSLGASTRQPLSTYNLQAPHLHTHTFPINHMNTHRYRNTYVSCISV